MNAKQWHYALDGEQKGPVSEEDFGRLITAGVVGRDTLVWTDGMAAWETLAQVRPDTAPPPPPTVLSSSSTAIPRAGQTVCGQCGQVVSTEDAVPLAGRMICARCKPIAVQMLKEGAQVVSGGAAEIRQAHLRHEAAIRSLGLLYVWGSAAFILVMVASVLQELAASPSETGRMLGQWAAFSVGFGVTFVACYVGPAILMLWLGLGLRRLNPVVRIPASILAGIGLIVFPIGTLISAYFLWLLLSPNGRTVFSADYRQVVAQTPHIKYRIPWWAWVMLSVVVGLVALLVAFLIVWDVEDGPLP